MKRDTVEAKQSTGYQKPPVQIANIVEAPPTPGLSISPDKKWMLLLGRPSLPTIEEVAQKELRLAGIRINPRTNGASRSSYYTSLTLKSLADTKEFVLEGLPENARIKNFSWSPDGSKIGFTITKTNGLELWTGDIKRQMVKKQTDAIINDAMSGIPYRWSSDNKTILYKAIVSDRGSSPQKPTAPLGPTIQENSGVTAAIRTYQDLLKNSFDEALFEYYTTSQLWSIDLDTEKKETIGSADIIGGFGFSPDGKYILVSIVAKPFSYIVPYPRFPLLVEIWDNKGKLVKEIAKIPVAEAIPKGFGATREGKRSFSWRADAPSTLFWVEAQDGGDPRQEAEVRDQLFSLNAPFTGEPIPSIKMKLRYAGVSWGNGNLAMTYEQWFQDRTLITRTFAPDENGTEGTILFNRSYEDRYNDPGTFHTTRNEYGRFVLLIDKDDKTLYLKGQGASPEGNRPFVDEFDITTKQTKRLWRSAAPYYESSVGFINLKEKIILTRKESVDERPNYFVRNLSEDTIQQITHFPNPYKELDGIKKELIKYKRKDGIELTGTLYLPKGYDYKERLPVLMWAYPKEYKSKTAAAQVKDSPYQFIRISTHSPIFWVTQGYAVFDDFGVPIIGEGEEEPNENFREQLVMSAEAAIDKLVDIGVADRNRLAVGGHSYGAFMTANLLAHSDLFAAGIARSGAYNRTLTPFGFQWEQRTYWEAPEIYSAMSPFMHADKIKAPILLIHGDADNNSGTYPMQSERFYAALKGHGATARLVMLPHESHGYQAKESILHMLWEMNEWLDRYVKER